MEYVAFRREAISAAIMYLHNASDAYCTRNDKTLGRVNQEMERFWQKQMCRFARVAHTKVGPEFCPICGQGLKTKRVPEHCPNKQCGVRLV